VLLAALTIARIAFGVQFQSVGAVGPAMVEDLGLAYASLGTLVGAYSILGLALALPGGWLILRLGDRRIVLTALALMIAGGLVLAAAPGFAVALAGRLISGTGAVLLMVSLPTIIMARFAGPALPAAMGTLLAGYPFGVGLGSVLLPAAASWRMAMGATAVLAAMALVGAAIVLDEGSGRTAVTRRGAWPGIRKLAAVMAAGLVWGAVNAGFAVLLGFAVVFFVGQGLSPYVAGTLVSLVAFATVPVGPLGGWLLGQLPHPLLGIAGGIALSSIGIALLPEGVAPAVLLVVIGVVIGATAGPIVALPAAVLAPEHRAMGMGVFWLVFFLLTSVLPPLAGLARDVTGAAAAPLYAAASFTALALVALMAFVGLRRPIVVAVGGG
jgi:predicted MFS family arabinose efflux permease